MSTKVHAILPRFVQVMWSGSEGQTAQLAVLAEDGKVYGVGMDAGMIMPVILGLLGAGRKMPEQVDQIDAQAIEAKGFQAVIHPDGTKGLAIYLGGSLELVLQIPQEALADLRAAIAEVEVIPTPKTKN